jgi:hypothetical protein
VPLASAVTVNDDTVIVAVDVAAGVAAVGALPHALVNTKTETSETALSHVVSCRRVTVFDIQLLGHVTL